MSPKKAPPPEVEGLEEVERTNGDVVIGSIIAAGDGSFWKVTDMAHPVGQGSGDHTLWWKVVNLATGEELNRQPAPRHVKIAVMERPEEPLPERVADPSDVEKIMLIVEKLGATPIATKDARTGDVVCPNYHAGHHFTPDWRYSEEFILHLELGHGIDVSSLRDPGLIVEREDAHSRAHDLSDPLFGKGGFPHRHVPIDWGPNFKTLRIPPPIWHNSSTS